MVRRCALFGKDPGEQPYDDGQVLALVVGGYDDGVFVSIRGWVLALHVQGCVALEWVHRGLVNLS